MENKKLIDILIKDMLELERLIAEIKDSRDYNSFEIEILANRATGIRHMLEFFREGVAEMNSSIVDTLHTGGYHESGHTTPSPEEVVEDEPVNNAHSPDFQNESEIEPGEAVGVTLIGNQKPAHNPKDLEDDQNEPEAVASEPINDDQLSEPQSEVSEGLNEQDETEPDEADEVELQEPDETIKEGQVLGDKFLKGKSLNDMVTDGGKLEHKLSKMPLSSIRAAIGINDRFLYTRELFDGNAELFSEAVTSLDNMDTIKEAVSYLRDNFKWRKNETSLKFVDLVKRRFLDE